MGYNPNNPNGSATSANSAPVVIASDQAALPLPTLAATSTKQSDGTQKTQITDGTNSAGVFVPGTANSTANAVPTAGTTESHTWSVTSVSGGTVYDVGNHAWVSLQILTQYTGTSPTTAWQISDDGTNWTALALEAVGSTATVDSQSTTSTGMYHGPLSGRYFRMNFTGAYSSGTATGTLVFSTTPRAMQSLGVQATQSGAWGVGVAAQTTGGYSYSNITTATTTTVKSGAGTLHAIIVNTAVASATITVYDSTTGSGTKIGTITLPATVGNPVHLPYDLAFATGLTLVTSGATDLTVLYK